MNTVTFDITKCKTVVTIVGSTSIEKVDITDTDMEKDFVKLLKQIRDRRDQNKILDALNIETWS